MNNPYKDFDEYGLRHMPEHLIDLEQWDTLEAFLTDLYFIEAKCAAEMTYELIADYSAALDALPEAQEENRIEREREARVQKYIQDLIAYSKGEIQTLEIIPSVEPWSEERIKADIERIKTNPTRLDRIRAFAQFVNAESHNFVKFAFHPGFVIQQAYNSARSGPVASTAENFVKTEAAGMLLLRTVDRPEYNPYPALLRTIEGKFSDVWLAPDGKRAVTWMIGSSSDSTLRVWDLEVGICRHILEGHTDSIEGVSITPDGKRAVSGGKDKILRVWDVDVGSCLYALVGHIGTIYNVSITPDGKRAVSYGEDKTLRVWDLEYGKCVKTTELITYPISSIMITPAGKRMVSTSADNTMRIWEIEYGECLNSIKLQSETILSVIMLPDGKQFISESREIKPAPSYVISEIGYILNDAGIEPVDEFRNLRMWDLESGICLKTLVIRGDLLETHPPLSSQEAEAFSYGYLSDIWKNWLSEWCAKFSHGTPSSITPDGTRVVSIQGRLSAAMPNLEVWDLQQGILFHMSRESSLKATNVTITPDGQYAALWGDNENTLEIWGLQQGRRPKFLEGHTAAIKSVKLTSDGKRAVSLGADGTLRVWELERSACLLQAERHHESVKFSIFPNGRYAVSIGDDHVMQVWNLEQGICLHTFPHVETVEVIPDGQYARLRDRENNEIYFDLEHGIEVHKFEYWGRGDNRGVQITPESQYVVWWYSEWPFGASIRIWDWERWFCVCELWEHDNITSMNLTPDGKMAIFERQLMSSEYKFREWNLHDRSFQELHYFDGKHPHTWRIFPDGTRIISIDNERLRVVTLDSGICQYMSKRVKGKISNLTPDGRRTIVVVGADNQNNKIVTLQGWNLAQKICLGTFEASSNIAITLDGKYCVWGNPDGTLWVWDWECNENYILNQTSGCITSISMIRPSGNFACATAQGKILFLTLCNFPLAPPLVTPIRLWLHEYPGGQQKIIVEADSKSDSTVRHGMWDRLKNIFNKDHLTKIFEVNYGRWDDNITTVCQWCGKRFPVSTATLDVINGITRAANLTPDQSPCLELPDEAWDEPKLLSECPLCHQPLKFNPFVVDNRERYGK